MSRKDAWFDFKIYNQVPYSGDHIAGDNTHGHNNMSH